MNKLMIDNLVIIQSNIVQFHMQIFILNKLKFFARNIYTACNDAMCFIQTLILFESCV